MATTNISNDYTITNYSASLGESKVRDPGNDTAGAQSKGHIIILASSTSNLDGQTVTIIDHNGLQKVYIFDHDGDGITGTLDGSNQVRVQITGLDKDGYATQLKNAIISENGHAGSIIVAGPGTALGGAADGKLHLTQSASGTSGDQTITSTANTGFLQPTGFAGGSTFIPAYKDADVIPHKSSIKGIHNLKGQTVTSRYRVFRGEEKS